MKKIYLLLSAAFLLGGQAFAQNGVSNEVIESQSNVTEKMETLPVSIDDIATLKNTYLKGKREENVYFDYIDEARTFGESYVYFSGMFMWPDSLPLAPFEEPSNINYHGGGTMFDPASDFLEVNLDAPTWTRHTQYTVDSAFVFYKYHNFGSTKDTILLTYTKDANVAQLSFNSGANPTASVRYDKNTNRVIAPDATQTIILDSSDNTDNFFSTDFSSFSSNSFEIGIDMTIEPMSTREDYTNLFGMTMQLLPGKGADSLNQPMTNDDSTNLDSNNLSLFSPLTMRGTSVTQEDNGHNFALMLFGSQRYTDRATEWFYPGNAPGSERLFTYTIFKMTGGNVGINEINDDVSFALSPNPISSGETLKADFKLRKSSNVTISISDLQGKELKVLTNTFYAPGEHLVDGDISDLISGVYFYNINTEYGSTSKKFIVQ
ncbi:MAG: T9SS type A sorting domain-containing protein [Bacteroidia bacterium]